MKITNPATGDLLKEIPEDNLTSLEKKFIEVKNGQKSWAQTSVKDRLECIKKFQSLLTDEKYFEKLAIDLSSEMGKPIYESRNELNGAVKRMDFFLDNSEKLLNPETVNQDQGVEEIIDFEPLGTVLYIAPWNYPYLVGINVLIPALIAGNSVVYKPSEFATLTGMHIKNLLIESGVPENVLEIVIGDGAVGEMLLNLPFDGIFFTGSVKTGLHIAKRVATKLVPLGLELGGKDPLYVTDEIANVKDTAYSVADGAFYNSGQSCCAVERVYVHEKIYDEFKDHFVDYAKSLKVGDPLEEDTKIGPIARGVHLDYLNDQVSDATSKGAKVLTGGKSNGPYFEPTVVVDVNHEMDLMKEETFGPIIGIQKVSSDEEAIGLMNDTNYGLTSSVFTTNTERGKKILSRIDSGTGYLNCCDRVSGYLPWAGRKHSGLGATLSKFGLWSFVKTKSFHLKA
jgi:acyl-CoA reductase-like NAD-dependent aldehyde dehydrogenase